MIPLADLRKQKRLEREQSQEPVAAASGGGNAAGKKRARDERYTV